MELDSDFDWISFEELECLKEDVRGKFVAVDFIDEERIKVLARVVNTRVEEL